MRQELDAGNMITFCIDDYPSREDMFYAVGKTLDVLTHNGYECSFKYDDVGVYILEFNYDDPEFGSPMIYWLDDEQLECLYSPRYIDEEYDKKSNTKED